MRSSWWLLLCLAMAGCGAVSDPMPPLLDIPESTAPTAVQHGGEVVVTWPAPTHSTEGPAPRPGHLGPILVYRIVLPTLKANPVVADLANSVKVAEVEPGHTTYQDKIDSAWYGHTVLYGVRMTNRHGDAIGFGKPGAATVLKTPPAPGAIRVEMQKETAVELRWQAQPGAMYRVYRDGAPIGDASSGEFNDTTFEFDHAYSYMVRGLAKQGDFFAESEDSPPMKPFTPQDTYPPQAPQGLRAVPVEGAVELSWTPNTERDLAGYFIYRGKTKLNAQVVTNTVYRDATPGALPKYHVVAVDTHGNASASSEEVVP